MKKYIPDCITLMNLLCGSCACILALEGSTYQAFILILAAACFDFCDGFAARMLGAYSDLGKELDSLCDLVSFGLAPALMLFGSYPAEGGYGWAAWATLSLPLAAALRLARFNTDPGQSTDFKGLPVPGAAMVAAPLAGFVQHNAVAAGACAPALRTVIVLFHSQWFIPSLAVILSLLMVSRVPMFSMKHKKLSFRKAPLPTIFICCLMLIAIVLQAADIASPCPAAGFPYFCLPLSICLGFTLYICLNLIAALLHKRS